MAQIQDGAPWWLRLSLRFAATSGGTWLLSRTLPHVDRTLRGISGGRLTLQQLLAKMGTPIVKLTTIGAKTGQERKVPVLGVRDGAKWVVVASNWGRDGHPAWFHNLRANPEVHVSYRGHTEAYSARVATDEERATYWKHLQRVNPGLETYAERAGDREIPVVVLSPAGDNESVAE